MKIARTALFFLGAALAVPAAQAQQAGDWLWRAGVHTIRPKSDNHALVHVDASQSLTFSVTYMLSPNWGVEALGGLPFSHTIRLNGGGKVGSTKQLPPTLSLQYHLNPDAAVRPYVGAGINYTLFLDEQTRGALAGSSLQLRDSWGLALQVGVDFRLTEDWFATLDGRWMDIDASARLNSAGIGVVELDPLAFGLSVGRRF